MAFGFQLGRGVVVGRQQHLERRAVADLGVELAGGASGDDGLVAGVALELGGQLFHRAGEVGGDRDLHLVGVRRSHDSQYGEQAGKAFHVFSR